MSRPAYLDNAATTAVRPEVVDAITPFLRGHFGNPSSAHALGRSVRAAVEGARMKISDAFDVDPDRVIFTSGGTEADNLAVLGTALAARAKSRPMRVAVSAVEHKAVLDAALAVARMGGERVVLPVDHVGRVSKESVERALAGGGMALVSVMWVNNETGTVQDVAALADQCASEDVPFHTDAVQSVGKLECRLSKTMMATISGHKIGAPKGIGALILADHGHVEPLIHGGGQQAAVRPGTENVIGIVGLGVAVELSVAELRETAAHTGRLRSELESRILAAVPDAQVNGGTGPRAPHISNITLPGIRSDVLTMQLDLAGIYCSTGSACNTGAPTPSHVLRAMGISDALAGAAVRFSFSRDNDDEDVERVMEVLPGIAAHALAGDQRPT